MIARLLGLMILSVLSLSSQTVNPFSQHRLDRFYNTFLEEERDFLEKSSNGGGSYNPRPPEPPPGPDVYYGDYLPITIDNNTITSSDSQIYLIVTGLLYDDANTGVVLQFDPSTGKGTIWSFANSTGQASDYAIALSSLPKSQHGSIVLYVPQIQSARVWLSVGAPLQMEMSGPNTLVEPNPKSSSDPNYYLTYDFFEFNFQQSASPPVFVDASAVDFFSMPIQCFYNSATTVNKICGLHHKQSSVLSTFQGQVNLATFDQSWWKETILYNGGKLLRIMSPGKAAAGSPTLFDTNFYQNGELSANDPNYVQAVWVGSQAGLDDSYYQNVPAVPLTIELVDGTVFQGDGLPDGSINLYKNGSLTDYVTIPNPGATPISVSILTQDDTITTKTGSVTEGQRKEVENLFTQGILSGLVPTGETLSAANFQTLRNQYFTINSNLTGLFQPVFNLNVPFYSVYSKSLTMLGNIYTMSVDEDLYPDVLVSGPYFSGSSYIGITLGGLN